MRRHLGSLIAIAFLPLVTALGPAPALARLVVHPTSFVVEVQTGGITTTPLHITNVGPASILGFTVSDDQPWMSEFPISGQIALGDTVEVTVTYDATALVPGVYTGTITVVDPHHGPIPIPVTLTVTAVTGIREAEWISLPSGLALAPSRPNPMRERAEIVFRQPAMGRVRVSVADVAGREVALLLDGFVQAGETRLDWDGIGLRGHELPSGVYFVRLRAVGGALARPLILVR